MGSSDTRKAKRSRANTEDTKKNGTVTGSKKQRSNRGRSEYRSVTRTARRGLKEEDEEQHEKEQSEADLSDDNAESNLLKPDDEKGRAYSALLNLLTVEQEEEQDSDEEEQNETEIAEGHNGESDVEEDPDHIAGLVEDQEVEEDDELLQDDDESDNEEVDPFNSHFANADESYVQSAIKALEDTKKWRNSKNTFESHSSIVSYPPVELSSRNTKIPSSHSLSNYKIKQKLIDSFSEVCGDEFVKENDTAIKVLDPVFSYNDVLFPYVSHSKTLDYRKLYALHVLNHVSRTTDRVLKDNHRLLVQSEKIASGKLDPKDEKEFRDQGFTRPKVLIMLPTRHQCYKVIQEMIKISGAEQVENQKKFKTEFYDDSEVPDTKPEDFRDLFEGNTNDFFCIGMKLNRKSLKLYTSYYASDIIFASPIGLQLILENPDKKKRQTDFLSSIEIMVVDQAHAIELQNWDHVLTVLKYVNKIPEQFHDTDFGRVRMWSIEDQAKYFTQSLIFTEYNTPNVNNLLTRSKNIFGKHRFRTIVSSQKSALAQIGLKIKQIFTRFETSTPFAEPEERFNHFKSVIVPSLAQSTSYEDGLLLYIPSYTDFIRIKNYLHNRTSLMFCGVNEYSSQQELGRSRALFQQGRRKILLYTERLHHYRRFDLKGVKNILMYGPPTNPLFYSEVVSSIGRSVYEEIADLDISTVRILYSKWDALALERIVGSETSPVLTHGQNEFYEFR